MSLILIDGLELVSFDFFSDRMPDTSSRNVEHLSRRGKFPPYIRVRERGRAYWRKDEVVAYCDNILAPLLSVREAEDDTD